MITKFAVKNYRGFADRIEWDLSHPSSYSFNTFAIKDGIIKNGIIYGPNGSGKSNLALALFDLILHLTQKSKNPHQVDTVVNVFHPEEFVSFEYSFRFDQDTIQYNYSKSTEGLEKETVVLNGKTIFTLENSNLVIESLEFPMTDENKKAVFDF